MTECPQAFTDDVQKNILPLIYKGALATLAGLESSESESGVENSNFGVGTLLYDNVNEILKKELTSEPFTIELSQNSLRIIYKGNNKVIRFGISRVDSITRLPHGSRKMKNNINNMLFLTQEIEDIALNSKDDLLLGYDFSKEAGVGQVSFGKIIALEKDKFYYNTLHVFNEWEIEKTEPAPEVIPQPSIKRSSTKKLADG